MSEDTLELLDERGKWRSREMRYFKGSWERVLAELPEFEVVPFRAGPEEPENPFLRTVLRRPNTPAERPIPVGTVSHSYGLAPHRVVATKCLEGIQAAGVDGRELEFEAGLSELGEWMNFRIYFPKKFNCVFQDGHALGLRMECFNSVDGSSRLVILLGWLRFVCSNGMVIGKTMVELRSIHNRGLDLDEIPISIHNGLDAVAEDKVRMHAWERKLLDPGQLKNWADQEVTKTWNSLAASRVLYICETGYDGAWADRFFKGKASERTMLRLQYVPGQSPIATNLFDVSQALSWVATGRNDAEERLGWQRQIPNLIDALSKAS